MRKWIENSPVSVGVALIVVGLIFIFLAWNGAAGKDFVEGQIPYLISGGIGGAILAAGGITTIIVQTRRRDTVELTQRLDEMLELLREQQAFPTSGGLTAVPEGEHLVVAGRSTYHDPSCRVVEGRADYRPMSPQMAADRGLTRCRICRPEIAAS